MVETIASRFDQEPKLSEYSGVSKLTWRLDGKYIEFCMGVASNKTQLEDQLSLISRLNGSHPLKIIELDDGYCSISASEIIEVYDSPQVSDSETSQLLYLARERARPRRVFAQLAKRGLRASIHGHEDKPDVWEQYNWVRGTLGLLLPNNEKRLVDSMSKQVVIPGGVNHQAVGESEQSSITIITTTAREHIHSTSL